MKEFEENLIVNAKIPRKLRVGSRIEGLISAIVRKPFPLSGFKVIITGSASIAIPTALGVHTAVGSKLDHEFFHHEVDVNGPEDGVLRPGFHDFTYFLTLPDRTLESMTFAPDDAQWRANISYMIQLLLVHPNEYSPAKAVCRPRTLHVLFSNPPISERPPAITSVQDVKYLCCLSRGTVSLTCQLEKDCWSTDELIRLTYNLQNNSSAKIQAVNVSIREIAQLKLPGVMSKKKRVLVSRSLVVVPYTSDDLEESVVQAKSGIVNTQRVTLNLPADLRARTLKAGPVSVSYEIVVSATTRGLWQANPDVRVPLTLHRPAHFPSQRSEKIGHNFADSDWLSCGEV